MKKNYILGPALIPDKKMFRSANDIVDVPHEVYFSSDTILKIKDKFHKNNFDNRVNINHDDIQVNGVLMTKSFILNEKTKLELPDEFQDLPVGTWMIEYEIENERIWKMIENKNLKGFSVEGIFNYNLNDKPST